MSAQTVLFDVPGPKARRLYRVIAAVGLLVLAALLAVIIRALANPGNSQFTAQKWRPFVDGVTWTAYLLPGLLNTLRAAGVAVVLSLVLGIALGMGRLAGIAAVRIPCGVLVEFFRSVPVLVMMLFGYFFCIYVLGVLGDASTFIGVVVGLTLYNASVIAELIRSGVYSLPRGQREAGLAVGLTPFQALTAILLPQAITAMLPSLISQLVVILKDTALGYIISYSELIRSGQNLSTLFGNLIPVFFVLALMFIAINYGLSVLARVVERRLQKSAKGAKPADPMMDPAEVADAATRGDARNAGAQVLR